MKYLSYNRTIRTNDSEQYYVYFQGTIENIAKIDLHLNDNCTNVTLNINNKFSEYKENLLNHIYNDLIIYSKEIIFTIHYYISEDEHMITHTIKGDTK